MNAIQIRPAVPADLDDLVMIENAVFSTDRLSRRSLKRFIAVDSAILMVAPGPQGLDGDALVGFRRGSQLARLYSIAVLPRASGRGLGRALLEASEAAARGRGATALRLEVRADNPSAIRLYERMGYRRFGIHEDYYEDGEAAWRYEKPLAR